MLTVYLDTSDYSELYRENLSYEMLSIRDKLFEFVDHKKIRVCFSFLVFFELMQDFNEVQFDDRLKRIKFLQRLCESNNFPFFADLLDGLSNNSERAWIPRELTENLEGNINSPELFFEHWFIKCENQNPIKFVLQNAVNQMRSVIDKLQMMLKEIKAKEDEDKNKVKKIRAAEKALHESMKNDDPTVIPQKIKLLPTPNVSLEINSITNPYELESFSPDFQKLIWEFIKAFVAFNGERNFQDSDVADLMHALYIPHCDLWRGDRSFSNLLLKSELNFKSKIVPSLRELPARIESALKLD